MSLPQGTFVVVPAHNEESVIGGVLDELIESYPGLQIVVVDDGSTDNTAQAVASRRVPLVHHIVNLGQGAAIATGFQYALAHRAEIVVTFDADGQMDARDVAPLVDAVASGDCDVALGNRFAASRPEGMTAARRALLRVARLFTRLTSGLPTADVHNGFRALSRKAVESMELTQNRMAHASEIVHEVARLGLRWREVPVRIRYTEYSRSKGQSPLGAIDILLDLLTGKR